MFEELYALPIPTIAKVNGAAMGGGVGLVATCDIAVASSAANFSLSEVRVGLVPACISPYLLQKVARSFLRNYFLTGVRFDASKAKEMGLVSEVVEPNRLDEMVNTVSGQILSCGPQALKMAKELLDRVPGMPASQHMEYTARMIANLRSSEEGQEGLSAFLEKRKPKWAQRH
jgi:methylglutaconyl-CoA hydratase